MDLKKDYLGRVVFNEDPTYSGRCKIKVLGLFDDFEVEQIPWFVPKSSTVFSSEKGFGSISIPKLNTIVRVRFPLRRLSSSIPTRLSPIRLSCFA